MTKFPENDMIAAGSDEMVRILIVDDQILVQNYFKNIIEENEDYRLAGIIDNAALADMYCAADKVDLILMDVCTADGQSGLKASEKLKKAYPKVKIIIVTSMPEVSFIEKAKVAGCDSFWYKVAPKKELEHIIARTVAGERIYPFEKPNVQIGNAASADFTDKELIILRELIEGNSQGEIAEKYDITRSAVKYHIHNMLQKTGYDSYVKLVIDVVDKRLIIPNY